MLVKATGGRSTGAVYGGIAPGRRFLDSIGEPLIVFGVSPDSPVAS